MRLMALFMLMATRTLAKYDCPSQCQCSEYAINCSGRGLKEIPREFPLTARRIDLSNNPSLQISRDYFLQFQHLFILLLCNCNLEGPFYLPSSIRDVRLDNNAFPAVALQQMISNKTQSLMRLSLQNNSLQTFDVQQVLRLVPEKLEEINFNSNNITKLQKNELRRLKKLKTVKLHNCSLQSIEPNVFDNLIQMSRLWIDDGDLADLPDGLFRYTTRLKYLNIAGNKLNQFNASKLGLSRVIEIDLGYNEIRLIDVKTLATRKLWLNNNKIHKLHGQLFNNNSFLSDIVLSNNNLNSLSVTTFKNIAWIGVLSLQHNRLKSLPKNIFKGITITKLLLQQNMLTDIKGILNRIKSLVRTLDLTGNKDLSILNGSDLQTLSGKSSIYFTCRDLATITDLSRVKSIILCSPKADLVIHTTNTIGLSCNGYSCMYNNTRPFYKCRACKQGYFSSCKIKRQTTSNCIQCPAGSYYQDEPASVTCKTCRPGQFVPPERSPGKDVSDCETCPQGTNNNKVAGTRACNCLPGYTRTYRFGPCSKCTSDGFNCTDDYPVLKNGFWLTGRGTSPYHTKHAGHRTEKQATCDLIYKAFIRNLDVTDDSYNRATMHFNCQMPLPIKCPMTGSCVGGIKPTCSTGYTGVLCAVCRQGYKHQFNQCIPCPQSHWATIQFISYIVLFAIFCFILSVTDKIIVEDAETTIQTAKTTDRRTVADVLLSKS